MKKKDVIQILIVCIVGVIITIYTQSCTRYYSPFEAANTGGKKCSNRNSIR